MLTANETEIKKGLNEGPFLFIVNPKSGTGAYLQFYRAIETIDIARHTIIECKSQEHMISLARNAKNQGYKACIAVGGDGTVHGIASQLIESDIALGIIPTGSGNGIARHFGISMKISQALQQVLFSNIKKIDTIIVNDHRAIGFCGIGFDAYVAKLFDEYPGRGFRNYIQLTLRSFQKYKPKPISINGVSTACFSLLVSNVNQLGNNAFINPLTVDNDGYLEQIRIQPPLWADVPFMLTRLFNKTFQQSKYVSIEKIESIKVVNDEGHYLHIDGESCGTPKVINIRVNPLSLNVLTP